MPSFIALCTPSLGKVSLWWSRMAQSLNWPMGIGKVIFYLQDAKGGEIAECRNNIVEMALEYNRTQHPITHLFWHDDDVLVFSNALLELLNQSKDIASGAYFLKADGPASQPLLWPGLINPGTPLGEFDLPAMVPFLPDWRGPIQYCGMGLTLVKLSVYERMVKELDLGLDKYKRPMWYKTATEEDYYQDGKGVVHLGFTEDVYFLRQAAQIGIQPYGVTTKHAFGFHTQPHYQCGCGFVTTDAVMAAMHAKSFPTHKATEGIVGYPEPQWLQWLGGGQIVWPVPGGEVVWD